MRWIKMVMTGWVAIAVIATGETEVSAQTSEDFETLAPEAWLQEDPAIRQYQRAREELNRRRYA